MLGNRRARLGLVGLAICESGRFVECVVRLLTRWFSLLSGVKHLEAIAEAGLPTPAVNQIEVSQPTHPLVRFIMS